MEMVWLVLMGLVLGGYFVLGGYDYGTQMLYPLIGRDERGRRVVRAALGPFFFGNEVWLIAFAGVLFGAFPRLEGTLISGLYPLFLLLLLGLVVGKAAVQLRSRARNAQVWDVLIVAGGLIAAVGWGLVVGVLLHGVPYGTDGVVTLGWSDVVNPFVVMSGVSNVLLLGGHGAVFLTLRGSGDIVERARRLARPLLLGAIAAVALTTALSGGTAVTRPTVAFILVAALVVALTIAVLLVARNRSGWAFAATSLAALLPVPLVGAGMYPYFLTSGEGGLTVSQGAADHTTLMTLLPFGLVLVPVIAVYQAWSWWLFRGRVGPTTPTYF
ncbi:cytochrome d ubiquinol oxidase subunit II [Actinosynnema sp. ALI-1.44]|uniref:cytochrome d ubiquinol oxidase subunit II n=1 Tax=Actinosynnema sp. ALI-1.44 TaxID=1933779 RepID=UPI00097BDB29|nr:cytochrome d ubiquinol oxidase subunit II [Actinosynnema sp. ALI-1.44]ONI75179.1 cytochrome d ubiquinol oxidase subunit II [Actinosynnema sp. ALI-1.44]